MTNLTRDSIHPSDTDTTSELCLKLNAALLKNQIQMMQDLQASGADGLAVLMEFLRDRSANAPDSTTASLPAQSEVDLAAGKAYQLLRSANSALATEFLQTHFPTGVVPLRSQVGIDYAPLQTLLAAQDFLAADQLTLQKLCELAGAAAVQRKWIYFSEVEQLPVTDLQTIDALWLVHSEGKFGFSVQREIWLGINKDWSKLWTKIGWQTGNTWTRYPQAFTWNLTAPKGHLPLSNQLRGVRAIASLLAHPAWIK
jgi:hypothetical protein